MSKVAGVTEENIFEFVETAFFKKDCLLAEIDDIENNLYCRVSGLRSACSVYSSMLYALWYVGLVSDAEYDMYHDKIDSFRSQAAKTREF